MSAHAYSSTPFMSVGDNNWLVADSEDEGIFDELPTVNGSGASATNRSALAGNSTSLDTSVIQTAAFTLDQPHTPQRGLRSPSKVVEGSLFTPSPVRMDSTIDNFTSALQASGAPSTVAPKPRPRPRVVMKKVATPNHNANPASTPFSHISDPPISTKRTNDSIHPATDTSFGFSEAVDDAYSFFGIAERAKMRSRKKTQTAKAPIHPQNQTIEVIELTSDDDELALKPTKRQKKQGNPKPDAPTKPRPKPTLRVKPTAVVPNDSPSSRTVIQHPPAPPAQQDSSQPPVSTLPTVPPSTPPQAHEVTPLSSPLVTARKRKRIRLSIAEDDDDIDIIGSNPTEVSPSLIMPPPFFAPSSSSLPTDSGIEIPPVESVTGRGKKKQSINKKETQTKTRNKGKKGKKVETTSVVTETVGESAGISQEPSTPAACHSPSERHSRVVRNSTATKKAPGNRSVTKKGKARAIDSCEEDEPVSPSRPNIVLTPPADDIEGQRSRESVRPDDLSPPKRNPPEHTSTSSRLEARSSTIKPKSTPMSELIRRVNSQPSSPFPNATRTYSPFLKSSQTMLSRIAPLHPNRRTPPPPPPRPPPPKKSKKQLEMEEKIEEELTETIDGWSCLTDEERKALRKARIDAELGYE